MREEMERTWGDKHMAILTEQESQAWLLGVGYIMLLSSYMIHLDGVTRCSHIFVSPRCATNAHLSFLQALRLFRLSSELEAKAAALKQEALQHLFVAIAGTDCRELWTLLTMFFGKGTDADPFEFLDAAPAIKKPLDLVDTDSDDESSLADSTTSAATAASSTASVPVVAKPATSTETTKDFKLPPKPSWPDFHASIKLAEGCIPRSANLLHHTGLPDNITCKRSDTQTLKGASLYICPHPDCGSKPYVGDLPGCGAHLRRVHYGTCILCPFCPDKRYYRVSGWKDHMSSKHKQVPWYGASEKLQAQLTMEAMTAPSASDVAVTQQEIPLPSAPTPEPFSSFTAPLPMPEPIKPEPPLEESLTYEVEPPEDIDPSSGDLSPEAEQALLDPAPSAAADQPRPPTPSDEETKEASMFAPSDSRQYDYSFNRRSGIISRFSKGPDPADTLAAAMVKQDLPPPEHHDPEEPPPQKKSKKSSVQVWPKEDSRRVLFYKPDEPPDDDAAPSMV